MRFTKLLRFWAVLGIILTLVLLPVGGCTKAPQTVDQVAFALNWLPIGEAAGWYVALDKGFFTEQNIAVQILRGYGSGDTIKRVAAGQVTFGVGDMGSLIVAKARENQPVKAVAMFFGKAPHGLFFYKDSGISKPEDLIGKTIACPASSANRLMFPAFASLTGIDATKVNWLVVDSAAAVPAFAARQADLVCEFATSEASIRAKAQGEVGAMMYADYGFDVYANAVLVREDTAQNSPGLVKRFVTAAMKGLDYGIQHPEEAVQILKKYNPEVDPVVSLLEWNVACGLINTPEAQEHGIGYMLPEKVTKTIDLVTQAFELSTRINEADLYTNEFLPEK